MTNKAAVGVGSASIILIFAVLCLTIFSLITLIVATNDKALIAAETELIVGYYEADALAELVLFEIMTSDVTQEIVRGVEIHTSWNDDLNTETIYFYCEISDVKALYVHVAIIDDNMKILNWQMRDSHNWQYNLGMDIWLGDSTDD